MASDASRSVPSELDGGEEATTKVFIKSASRRDHSSNSKSEIRRLARVLLRLQRRLQVEPPIFRVNAARTEITLWDPRNVYLFGDIKPDLEKLLEDLLENSEEVYDSEGEENLYLQNMDQQGFATLSA